LLVPPRMKTALVVCCMGEAPRKDSSFSEEKEAKKLYSFEAEGLGLSASNE